MLPERLVVTYDSTLDPALLTAIGPWLLTRRWFPVKGTQVVCTPVGGLDLDTVDPRVRVLLVTVEAPGVRTTLQVPLMLGDDAPDPLATLDDGLTVHDGAGHPAFVTAWLAAAEGPATHGGEPAVDPDLRARVVAASSQVVTAEQSNTSVIVASADAPVGVLKVLRSLTPGDNPDVDVPRHLVDAGWDGVPAPLGWLRVTCPDEPAPLCLGVLTAFVPGASDGFGLACDHARTGTSFEELAAGLGTVVAGMHRALAESYPAPEATDDSGARLAAALRERLAWAVEQVPDLGAHAEAVRARADALASCTGLPAVQRVHGDLHLGQVLRSDGRWYITDFEGEPLAPLHVRTRPDLVLRDVAGVLRSFDYAAAVGGLDGGGAETWVTACRTAFWDAYCKESDDKSLPALADVLSAMELDKVLYEVVYESRNRPDWVAIPTRGLERLLS